MSTKCLPVEQRRQIIRENILKVNYETLAEMCNCTKKTIYRTVHEWKQEGGFDELLFDEFVKLYPKVEEVEPSKALDKLVYLLGKGMTSKTEIKSEHKEEIVSKHVEELNVTLRDYRDSVQAVVDRYIRKNGS